jgi:hypothetical protein
LRFMDYLSESAVLALFACVSAGSKRLANPADPM